MFLPVSINDLRIACHRIGERELKVLEGKELQDIRRFSGEDIPVFLN
jgi:hypothetical protein